MNLPMTPILFHFEKSVTEEPPVGNQEFLESYYRYGSCLRLVALHCHHEVLSSNESTELERFAAIVEIYSNLGMLYEDLAASLVAWAAWAKDRTLLLTDLYERTFFTTTVPPSSTQPYHEEAINQFLTTNKTVRIHAQRYVESLATLPSESILWWLGIPWKLFPSVKLVPREGDRRREWNHLPEFSKAFITVLAHRKTTLLAESYNKLKHGPQLIVMSPRDVAINRRSLPQQQVDRIFPGSEPLVRLLFDGSRTQEAPGEVQAGGRVAPFVVHHPETVRETLIGMLSNALWVRNLSWWLLRFQFGADLPKDVDKSLDPWISRVIDRAKWFL